MILLDGRITAQSIKDQIREELNVLLNSGNRKPHLAAILVGNDGASRTYIDSKEKNSREIGFDSTILRLPDDTSETVLLEKIRELNDNPEIDGILVQSPLPSQINENRITQSISPEKDVDGFHDINMGKLAKGIPGFVSATPLGVVMLLKAYNIETRGKHCVIVGRSNIVGKPMSLLMSANTEMGNCTVTLCHSKTVNLENYTLQADILIAALGSAGFIKKEMVKEGAIVIDVGISRVDDSSRKSGFYLKGDVDFEKVKEIASYLTPVPGGVGLMTIAALLSNTFKAYKQNLKL